MKEYAYTECHMGTDVTLSFVCDEKTVSTHLAHELFKVIHDYEQVFSRFSPGSELSRLNREKSLHVSDDFLAVLTRSIELATLTEGAFNPLLRASQLGYIKDIKEVQREVQTLYPTDYNTDLSQLTIDYDSKKVTLAHNQELDFGGVLKGYLADKLADDVFREYPSCTGLIINIGGDLSTRGHDALHEPFIFQLYNPVTGEETAVTLTDTSLATSGTYARTWQTNAGMQHHIIDNVSKQNPTPAHVATSIIARDGALTEALTKLFLIRGVAEAVQIVPPATYDYQYYVVTQDGQITSNIV